MTDPTHLSLLHRVRTALVWPNGGLDREALLRDLDLAIDKAYPKRPKTTCYCGEQSCTEHSEFEVGEG